MQFAVKTDGWMGGYYSISDDAWLMYVCMLFWSTGVKNADENELRSIASDPDEIHMYNVNDFSFLLDIVDDLTVNLCNSVKGPGNLFEAHLTVFST